MTGLLSTFLLAGSAAALASSAPVWLCIRLKTELKKLSSQADSQAEAVEKNAAAAERMLALEARVESFEQSKAEHAEWISEAESLHLNRRGQVLRLHHRGESVPEIASALRVGQGEVKLMIKIHEICRETASPKKNLALS